MTTQPAVPAPTTPSSTADQATVLSTPATADLTPQPPANPSQVPTLETTATTSMASSIKLTGRLLNFTRLSIQGNDVESILATIAQKLGRQRQSRLPVVVSCQDALDLAKLWEGLWSLGLQPIGIVTGVLDELADSLRIAIFPADGQRIDGKTPPKPAAEVTTPAPTTAAAQANPDANPAPQPVNSGADHTSKLVVSAAQIAYPEGDLVHRQMLRSGQTINHVGGNVILTKGINAGAEAITDYSLHIYGKAEGRLVAGATGDPNAKIFCLRFNPSLVSVAGTYCLRENIPSEFLDKAVQVTYVEGQGLVFECLEG
ncbi:MAG: septum site-determining protein MinC [Moraxella sp.]